MLNLSNVVYMPSPEILGYFHLFIILSINQYLLSTYPSRVGYLWIKLENLVFGNKPRHEQER